MPLRRAARLATQLPPQARTNVDNDARLAWHDSEWILANIFDAINAIAYGLGGKKASKPKPHPRPQKARDVNIKRRRTREEIHTILERRG